MLNKKVELKWFYLSDRFYLILWADQKFDISSFIRNASFHVIVIHRLKVMHAGRLANDCHSSTNTSQPNSEYDRKINTHKNPIKHLLNDTHTHTHTYSAVSIFICDTCKTYNRETFYSMLLKYARTDGSEKKESNCIHSSYETCISTHHILLATRCLHRKPMR